MSNVKEMVEEKNTTAGSNSRFAGCQYAVAGGTSKAPSYSRRVQTLLNTPSLRGLFSGSNESSQSLPVESGIDSIGLGVIVSAKGWFGFRPQPLPRDIRSPMYNNGTVSQDRAASRMVSLMGNVSRVQMRYVETKYKNKKGEEHVTKNEITRPQVSNITVAPPSYLMTGPPLTSLGTELIDTLANTRVTDQTSNLTSTMASTSRVGVASMLLLSKNIESSGNAWIESGCPLRLMTLQAATQNPQEYVKYDPLWPEDFPDFVIEGVSRPRYPAVSEEERTAAAVMAAAISLDDMVAILCGSKPVSIEGMTRQNLETDWQVVPVRDEQIDDPAFWIYVTSFVDTAVWQGRQHFVVEGALNMDETIHDQAMYTATGNTADSEHRVCVSPYSDRMRVVGGTKILFVLMDMSSRTRRDGVRFGDPQNSIEVPVYEGDPDDPTEPVDIAPNIRVAVSGSNWEQEHDWENAGDVIFTEAWRMLEKNVLTADGVEMACGLLEEYSVRFKDVSLSDQDKPIQQSLSMSMCSNKVCTYPGTNGTWESKWPDAPVWIPASVPQTDAAKQVWEGRALASTMLWGTALGQCGARLLLPPNIEYVKWLSTAHANGHFTESCASARILRGLSIIESSTSRYDFHSSDVFMQHVMVSAQYVQVGVGICQLMAGVSVQEWRQLSKTMYRDSVAWVRGAFELLSARHVTQKVSWPNDDRLMYLAAVRGDMRRNRRLTEIEYDATLKRMAYAQNCPWLTEYFIRTLMEEEIPLMSITPTPVKMADPASPEVVEANGLNVAEWDAWKWMIRWSACLTGPDRGHQGPMWYRERWNTTSTTLYHPLVRLMPVSRRAWTTHWTVEARGQTFNGDVSRTATGIGWERMEKGQVLVPWINRAVTGIGQRGVVSNFNRFETSPDYSSKMHSSFGTGTGADQCQRELESSCPFLCARLGWAHKKGEPVKTEPTPVSATVKTAVAAAELEPAVPPSASA